MEEKFIKIKDLIHKTPLKITLKQRRVLAAHVKAQVAWEKFRETGKTVAFGGRDMPSQDEGFAQYLGIRALRTGLEYYGDNRTRPKRILGPTRNSRKILSPRHPPTVRPALS